ncbi:ROK family glucokinase [Trichococcus sp. K1Tr]|uniref:ROK family glucokinase n=1 Tax=Trichococcus sp. K1Tr TaxID=3020847 RepID=UPI00232E48E0|nr:ROK family glucokinase [Trichococcus sp. K1Tr]MDB6353155.1 ROK family glucokinase [Trichococcus sp. K1Tr]
MHKKVMGIDLGGTSVKLAILSEEGEVLQKWSIPTDNSDHGVKIMPDIIESIKHHLDLYRLTPDDFLGIGMGSPGAVDRSEGTVTGAFNLNWVSPQPVRETMEQETGIPFFIDNDANVAALGEKWRGAGEDNHDVVFITLGTGVGGGIIADGHLIHGTAGSGGEIGHMTVDPDGFECTCGKNGCLETVASATGVVQLARKYAEEYAGDSTLKSLIDDGQEITSKMIFDFAKDGDALALIVVDRFAYFLGLACSHIGNLLNPAYIIIGGGVSAAGELLLEKVNKHFLGYAFPNVQQSTKLKLAELGNDAGVVGASYLVVTNVNKC